MNQSKQPEALRLAAWLEVGGWPSYVPQESAAELRRLYARVHELEAGLKKANAQAEHFEREWYLRGDELEAAQSQREPLNDPEIESATGAKQGTPLFLAAKGFAIAIERAHGIGKETK